MRKKNNFATLVEGFFTDRLMRERQASAHTIASYRDTFSLLFRFAQEHLKKEPSNLTLDDLNAPFIGLFLDHLEKERSNSIRTRNVRLAAIHSFFRYVALLEPSHSALIQRVLSIPTKRCQQSPVEYLTPIEVEELLAAPNTQTWSGRRDHALLLLAIQTGLRVSELSGLKRENVFLGSGPHVRCWGKGRKERCTPLRKDSVAVLRAWLNENPGSPSDPLFPSDRKTFLTCDGIRYILSKHVKIAQKRCPTLKRKRISPHLLRHTTAMDLLHNQVDRFVIAMWLGHESVDTTQKYIHADMELKEAVLRKTAPLNLPEGHYKPNDQLLAFLKKL